MGDHNGKRFHQSRYLLVAAVLVIASYVAVATLVSLNKV